MGSGRGRPRQTDLRRAISAAYYALFHALAATAANTLIGADRRGGIEPLWARTYRTLEHGYARSQCNSAEIGLFSPAIRDFAAKFVDMQSQRHDADYNPGRIFTRPQVMTLIDEVEEIIVEFENAPAWERRAFAVHALFRLSRR